MKLEKPKRIGQSSPPRNKTETNEQLLRRMCRRENQMVQVFILDACLKQAQKIVDTQDEVRKRMKNHWIHPNLWIHCAEVVLENMNGPKGIDQACGGKKDE